MKTSKITTDVAAWAREARRGDSIVYFRSTAPHDQLAAVREVRKVPHADAAMRLSDEGVVALVQRKNSFGGYDYEAQRL